METNRVRNCPLCGSEQIRVLEPDAIQTRIGYSLILKCECGAVVTMTVLKPEPILPTRFNPSVDRWLNAPPE
jgi:hypothetical protein